MAIWLDNEAVVERLARRVLEELFPPGPPRAVPAWPERDGCPVVPVGVSVRHVHLCRADLETLFGAGHELTKLKDLTEPGEFAAREVLTLVGPRLRALDGVRILGPLRQRTQVELAFTDCILLGVEAPVRRSGDLAGTAPITLVGPCGTLRLKEGAIRANRHIHVPTAWLTHYGLQNDHEVRVRVEGEKALTFDGVQVRGGDELKLEMHLDTDDANAAAIRCGSTVEVILPDRGGCRCSSAK